MAVLRKQSLSPVVGRDVPLWRGILGLVIFFASLLLAWQWKYDSLIQIPNMRYIASLYASPQIVWDEIVYIIGNKVLDGNFIEHLWVSTRRVTIGLVIGTAIGYPLGVALVVFSPYARFIGRWLIYALLGVSKISVLYLMIIWFDDYETPKYAIGIWATFMYQLVASSEGARARVYGDEKSDYELMRALNVLGPSKWLLYRRVVLPMVRDKLFLALLLVNPVVWLMLILAEATGPQVGLGAIVSAAYGLVNAERIMAGTVLLTICVLASSFVIWTLRTVFVR